MTSQEHIQTVDDEYKPHSYDDKPAIISENGTLIWMNHGIVHRDGDKPAIIASNGGELYVINGLKHRENNKPALINQYKKAWYVNGKRHNSVAPAVIHDNGEFEWWYDNTQYTFSTWIQKTNISEAQKSELIMVYR